MSESILFFNALLSGVTLEPWHIAFIAAAFVLGGIVKGTLGVGLPMFVIPILAYTMPAAKAIAILMLPVIVSNLWQFSRSGISRAGVKRFLPLIIALVITTLVTVRLTLNLPDAAMRIIVASMVLLAIVLLSLELHPEITPAHEKFWNAGVGFVSGLMGGVSTLTGPVITGYLMALKLPREVFVGTISVIYLAGAISVYGSMLSYGSIAAREITVSTLALLPMSVGLYIGQKLRGKLSELMFRKLMLVFLSVVAIGLIATTLMQ